MPACAAPRATKVATSNARTRMMRMSPRFVGEAERAVALVVERAFRHDAGARHHGQRLVEDAALGHGEGQRFERVIGAELVVMARDRGTRERAMRMAGERNRHVMEIADVREAIEWQAPHMRDEPGRRAPAG